MRASLFPIILQSLFVATIAVAAEPPVRILSGGHTTAKAWNSIKADIEKRIGAPFEITVTPNDAGTLALSKDLVDGVVSPMTLEELFVEAEKKGMVKQNPSDYQAFELSRVSKKIGVHPSNPVERLTHEQVRGIFSGEIKTWEPITGQKIPIKVLMANTYQALFPSIEKTYLGGKKSPVIERVIDVKGLLRGMQNDPGSFAVFSLPDKLPDFTPKFLDSDIFQTSALYMKKDPRPAAKKFLEFLKSDDYKNIR